MKSNKFFKWIYRIVFQAVIFALALILVVVLFNYFNINNQVQKIEKIQTVIEKNTLMISKCEIEEYMRNIDVLKRSVFDNNAITFMVSFVLVSLVSMWLIIDSKARKTIEKAERTINRLKAERKTTPLYSQVLSLQVLSINFQNALELDKKGDSLKLLGPKTYNMADRILKKLQEDKRIIITKKDKGDFDEILENMADELEKINSSKGNPAKDRFEDFTKRTIEKLKELQIEISRLRVV